MLSSIGSLRRTKSTSTVISRRSSKANQPSIPNVNLTPTNQYHAQAAAATAYERSIGYERSISHEQALRQPRSTIVNSFSSAIRHRRSSAEFGSTIFPMTENSQPSQDRLGTHLTQKLPLLPQSAFPRRRSTNQLSSSCALDPVLEARPSNDNLPQYSSGLHKATVRRNVSTLLDMNERQAQSESSSVGVTPLQNASLSGSRSMRRTLRKEEPRAPTEIQRGNTVQTTEIALSRRDSGQYLESRRSFAQLRKSKSNHTGDVLRGPNPLHKTDTLDSYESSPNRSCEAYAPPSILRHSESAGGSLNGQVLKENLVLSPTAKKPKHRASFISLAFRRRDFSTSSKVIAAAPPEKENSYPITHVVRDQPQPDVAPLDSQRLAGSRTFSTSSSKKSSAIRSTFARLFRKSSVSSFATRTISAANGGLPLHCIEAADRMLASAETQHDESTGPSMVRASIAEADLFDVAGGDQSYTALMDKDQMAEPPGHHSSSAKSPTSQSNESQSRVTSWATSTVTGENERLSAIVEDAFSPEKLGAYLICASKAKESKCPEIAEKRASSFGSAFLERRLKKSNDHDSEEHELQAEELARQKRRLSIADTFSSWRNRQTVRAVPSEVLSERKTNHDEPRAISPASLPADSDFAGSPVIRRKPVPSFHRPQHKEASAALPSPAVRSHRATRANSRWAAKLDESQGLFFPRSPVSSNRGLQSRASVDSNFWVKAKDNEKGETKSNNEYEVRKMDRTLNVVSPSVYSQASGFGDNSSHLWRDGNRTATIIESRTYATESPTRSKDQASNSAGSSIMDWAVWLKKEVAELEEGVTEVSFEEFTEHAFTSTPPRHQRESTSICKPEKTVTMMQQKSSRQVTAEPSNNDPIIVDIASTIVSANMGLSAQENLVLPPDTARERNLSQTMTDRSGMVDEVESLKSPAYAAECLNDGASTAIATKVHIKHSNSSATSTSETSPCERPSLLEAREQRQARSGLPTITGEDKHMNSGDLTNETCQQVDGKKNISSSSFIPNCQGRTVLQSHFANNSTSPFPIDAEPASRPSTAPRIAPYTTTGPTRTLASAAERRTQGLFGRPTIRAPLHSEAALTSSRTAQESPWNLNIKNEDAGVKSDSPSATIARSRNPATAGAMLNVAEGIHDRQFPSSPLRQSMDSRTVQTDAAADPESSLPQTRSSSKYSITSDQSLLQALPGPYQEKSSVSSATLGYTIPAATGERSSAVISDVAEHAPLTHHHVSRLPVPTSYVSPEIAPSHISTSLIKGYNKENSPRSTPAQVQTPTRSQSRRLTRGVVTESATNLNRQAYTSSPCVSSPTKSQTGGQKLAEKWLTGKSIQNTPVSSTTMDASEVTQIFL